MNSSTSQAGFRSTGGLGARPSGAARGGPSSGAGRTGGLPGMASHAPKREVVTVVAEESVQIATRPRAERFHQLHERSFVAGLAAKHQQMEPERLVALRRGSAHGGRRRSDVVDRRLPRAI